MKNPYKILARKSEGKRYVHRPMSRWEYNTEVGLELLLGVRV
jgi:hypothetical protein